MTALEEMIAGAGGTPSAFTKDTPVGTVVGGRILDVAVRQVRDYESGEPQFWDDGQPQQQVVITVQTDLRDPAKPDDDGRRGIYVKWWGDQRKALVAAVKAAGDTDVRVGGEFYAQYVGEKPNEKNPRLNPSKVYAYQYVKPATGLDFGQLPGAQAPAPAPAPVPQSFPQAVAAQAATPPPFVQPPAPQPVPADPAPSAQQAIGGADAAGHGAGAPSPELIANIRTLIAQGADDALIASTTGATGELITAIRNAPVA